MIILIVVMLYAGPINAQGWKEGDYGAKSYSYSSIAACEASRGRAIRRVITYDHPTLISQCATANDPAEFRWYGGRQPASTPVPAPPTPQRPSAPPSLPPGLSLEDAA